MKTFKYNPEQITVPGVEGLQDSGFRGEIVLKVPFYKDRLAYIRQMGDNDNENAAAVVEYAVEHIEKIDITHTDTGEKFTSVEELGCFAEGTLVINDIGRQLLQGVRLGNLLRPS